MPKPSRRPFLAGLTVLMAVLASGVVLVAGGGAAQAATPWRTITNVGSGKCLDSALEDLGKPTPKIQIWSCVHPGNDAEGAEQQWVVENSPYFGSYLFRNRMTQNCLTVSASVFPYPIGTTTGVCFNKGADYWELIHQDYVGGWVQVFRNRQNALCLDVTGGSSANGTVVQQFPCDLSFTNPAQQWRAAGNLPFVGSVTVPNVSRQSQQSATNVILGAGLAVSTITMNDCLSPGDVVGQRPSAGSFVSPGVRIQLTISSCTGGGVPK